MRWSLRIIAALLFLFFLQAAPAQVLDPWRYIKRQLKGDTLVIKDYYDMGGQPNSLYEVLAMNTVNVPAGRVYELQAGGWYPLTKIPVTSSHRPTVIVGADARALVTNRDSSARPAIISGFSEVSDSDTTGLIAQGDLIIKNCALVNAGGDKSLRWNFIDIVGANRHVVLENDLFERTRRVFVTAHGADCDVTFRNCYFVNMNGQPCRRDGGVFDAFADVDTLLVENCTFINAQGSLFRFRSVPENYQFHRTIINHNTFINCAGSAFMNPGYQNNFSLTNNIFVNCNIIPIPTIRPWDYPEQDPEWLPMGFVNVYHDSANTANQTPRKFLVMANDAYWDPFLNDMIATLNTTKVNGVNNWQSQMITMNARTDSMFKHWGPYNAKPYTYLTTDPWRNIMPAFTDPKNLFQTTVGGALFELKKFTLATVDTGATGSTAVLPDCRLASDPMVYYVFPDWPIPVDLSYVVTPNLKGIGGFPMGDLNWFPAQKAVWLAQRSAEYSTIDYWLNYGPGGEKSVESNKGGLPGSFSLEQNYPNPFNPSTTINFGMPRAARAKLVVYDILGREVAHLADGLHQAGYHTVTWNAQDAASGVYFARLTVTDEAGKAVYSKTNKLVLTR